jgi:putative flippase GtrA
MESPKLVLSKPLASFCTSNSVVAQFLRYAVVGGIASVVDFGIFDLFYRVLTPRNDLVSVTAGFCCGLVLNYLLSILWVFDARSRADAKTEFAIFALIGLIGWGLTYVVVYLGSDVAGLPGEVSKLFAMIIVLAWNFGMRKLILFNKPAMAAQKS